MKKVICLLISLTIILSLTSCNNLGNTVEVTDPNAGYSIEKEGKNYYLVIDEFYSKENNNGSSGALDVAPSISFSSVKEMRETVLGGKLTDGQKKAMSQFSKDENGKIKILDFNNLYDAMLPSDVGYVNIVWSGDRYSFTLSEGGSFRIVDENRYEELYQTDYIDNIQNNPLVEITETKSVDDRNSTEYYYKTKAGEYKSVQYKIVLNNGEIHIREDYKLYAYYSTTTEVSNTKPYRILIYGNMDGGFFGSSIYGFFERPSVEWLSSFGLEKLKID